MVFLFPLGMVNENDYAGDLLLVYGDSVGDILYLRITLQGNNSTGG